MNKKILIIGAAMSMAMALSVSVAHASAQVVSVGAPDAFSMISKQQTQTMVTNEVIGVIATAQTSFNSSEALVAVSKNNKTGFHSVKATTQFLSCGKASQDYEHYIPIGLSAFEGAPVLGVLAEPLKAVPI